MKRFLGAVVSAVGLLMVVTTGVAFADQCRYECYDFCQQIFPGAAGSFERHACYEGCDIGCG